MLIETEKLGSDVFKKRYNTHLAYASGAMYKGIASAALVIRMGRAGLLSFLGTSGLRREALENALLTISNELTPEKPAGANLLHQPEFLEKEWETAKLLTKYQIKHVEAAAYMQLTPGLIWYRLKGIHQDANGKLCVPHTVLAKLSRPEVAELFMAPAPINIVRDLVASNWLTADEAALSQLIPVANAVCVEADSGGHTDQGVAYTLFPSIRRLRNRLLAKYHYSESLLVGAAGGIGTPEAAAAAFLLGADFIITGSINQCTVEAGTSDAVKDILQTLDVQDTTYAPAGDMFELGAKVQVARKGLFFPARANKLYDLYRFYDSWEAIDAKTREQLETRYFLRSFAEVWEETKAFYSETKPETIIKAETNSKHKLALVFRWYFIHTTRLAMQGSPTQRVDYQIHCGPALGAFNQWVKGTSLENWQARHVDVIAKHLMQETASVLNDYYCQWLPASVT